MTDRLNNLRMVDPVLTTIALGYKNAAFISEALFPVAGLEKEAAQIPQFGKESFRLHKTERALRAASNEMQPDDARLIDVFLTEHDLSYPIDRREKEESMFDEQAKAVRRAKDAIELGREVSAANLAQNPASYGANSKKTIAAADQWSATTGKPVEVVDAAKEAMRKEIGVKPNILVMGPVVYQALKYHPQIQALLGCTKDKIITIEMLKSIFGLQDIVIGEAAYATDKNDTFGDIWGNNIIMAYVATSNADPETPSFGYTFRKNGMPQADTYDKEGGKIQYCRYTDIYKQVVVGPEAGYLIQNCAKV